MAIIVSYGICAAVYFILTVVLFMGWQKKRPGGLLISASASSVVWALSACFSFNEQSPVIAVSFLTESVRNLIFFLFLLELIRGLVERVEQESGFGKNYLRLLFVSALISIFISVFSTISALSGWSWISGIVSLPILTLLGHLGMSVIGLALIEQVYRNTHNTSRWGIRYLCLGLGMAFALEFYLYADAVLFQRIDPMLWVARAWGLIIIAPLIAVSAARNPQWSLDVYVSRRLVFHTASIMFAGVYLLVMALAGYYIREFGGSWGRVGQVVLIVAATLGLLIFLLSGQIRAWLKVTLNKHFYNYKYDYREEWLRFTQTLSHDNDKESVRQRALRAIAEIIDSPAGLLWSRNDEGSYDVSVSWNCPVPEFSGIEASHTLVSFLRESQWVIDLEEFRNKPENYQSFDLPDCINSLEQAWLLVPLVCADELIALLVLFHPRARRSINWEDCDLLKTAGVQAASQIAQEENDQKLTIARQFEAYNRLSTFVIHDLKNLAGQLTLLSRNAEKHRDNPEFIDDVFITIDNSVGKINHLLEQLRYGSSLKKGQVVSLEPLLKEIVRAKSGRQPCPEFECESSGVSVLADYQELNTVIGHIVQNAQEASQADGLVRLILAEEGEYAKIAVIDKGCGMDKQFIQERLFKPFDTTKGDSGMGVGVYQAKTYITQLGGYLEVNSEVGKGSEFIICIPCLNADEAGT